MGSWSKLLLLSTFLLLVLPISIPYASASSGDITNTAINEAEEISISAYEAVLEAEQAGVNVSILLDKLNLGGENLAEAYAWYHLGSSDNANHFARLCYEIMEDVKSEALELMDEANSIAETNFVETFVMSGVSVVIVAVLCYFSWLIFRQRYLKRVLGSRPEVVSNES